MRFEVKVVVGERVVATYSVEADSHSDAMAKARNLFLESQPGADVRQYRVTASSTDLH